MKHDSPYTLGPLIWEPFMNDKTVQIPASSVKRAYIEAIEATHVEPTIIENGKVVEEPKDANDPNYWKPGSFILPPMSGRPSVMESMINRSKETTQAFNMLKDAGFTDDQVDHIRKAVCKKTKAAADYWWQYKTLFAAKFPNEMPIRAEENWQIICNLFDKPNPLEPKEYFTFYESESDRLYMMRATDRLKKMMKLNAEIADDLNIPTAVKVKTVKPDQPVMRKMYGVAEGIEPTFQKHYRRTRFPAEESARWKIGDHVEFNSGDHKGKAGQIVAIDDGKTWPAFGPKKFSVRLHESGQSVTCHECQVTHLSETIHFRRYDRVKLRHGSSKGREGTVTRVNDSPDGWVFVMLDGQTDKQPAGFDAWKLEMTRISTNMPRGGEEVIYFGEGQVYNQRRGIIGAEYDNGDVLVRFTEHNPDHGGFVDARVTLGDIPRLLSWADKEPSKYDVLGTINTKDPLYKKVGVDAQRVMTVTSGYVEGCSEKQVERLGEVTIDTRGIEALDRINSMGGNTEVIVGLCVCDLNALMMHGCKCGQPVKNEIIVDHGKVAASEVKNECTCPMNILMVSGCKCGSIRK